MPPGDIREAASFTFSVTGGSLSDAFGPGGALRFQIADQPTCVVICALNLGEARRWLIKE
jgi:hypothetical protein